MSLIFGPTCHVKDSDVEGRDVEDIGTSIKNWCQSYTFVDRQQKMLMMQNVLLLHTMYAAHYVNDNEKKKPRMYNVYDFKAKTWKWYWCNTNLNHTKVYTN